MELRYPSDTFPGPPAIAFTLPDGWEPFTSAAAVVCASDPGSPEHFRSNVVVIMSKVVHEHSSHEVAELLLGKTAADYGGSEVLVTEGVTVAGLDAVLSTVGFQPPQAAFPVAQVQGVVMLPTAHEDVRYAVQFHGTCARDVLSGYEPVFRDCFTSLTVG